MNKVKAGVVAAAALLYGISPIDIVPDAFLPVGFADDAAVIIAAVFIIRKWLSGSRHTDETGSGPAA